MSLQKKYELQAIGRFLADKKSYPENAELFTPEMFVHYEHLFTTYQKEFANGRTPTLTKFLSLFPQDKETLIDAVKSIDYGTDIETIAGELAEIYRVRFIDTQLTAAGMQKTSEGKMQILSEIASEILHRERGQYETGFEAALKAVKILESKKATGIATGFAYFDELTGGLQKSDLIIIAAETSQGKTSLALNISQSVIDQGRALAFISLEMSSSQLITRMVCADAEIEPKQIKHELERFVNAASRYQDLPLYVADVTNNNLMHILGLIRTAHIRYGIEVAVIDYLQLLGDKSQRSREQELGQIARALKNIAKELNINIIALSQLSRPKTFGNHYPTLSRLRDSGQIEEAADVVLFIYRAEAYGQNDEEGNSNEGQAELIIAKGRNYGTGKFTVEFKREYTKFVGRVPHAGYGTPGDITGDAF